MPIPATGGYDFDWVVIGSGFGGSVSALRLAEKGYSVCVLECGRRFADNELPDTMWSLRDCYWAPRLGLMGITRLTFFRDLAIVSGAGVGGGSLVFANTLYRASQGFLHELERAIGQPAGLGPFYDAAERMPGVVTHPRRTKLDELAIATATDLGYGSTFQPSRVGIFYGTQPGVTVPDPYFDGEGPDRTGCLECGACLLGCKHGAKNHTMKNYLWLAERRGVVIRPQCQVTDIRPLAAANGADGYAIVHRHPRGRGRAPNASCERAPWSSPRVRSARTCCSPAARRPDRCRR